MELNKFTQGEALEQLRKMPDNLVHCIVTSPPYWGLRNYGVDQQLGMEHTPEGYIQNMVDVFRECRRLLRDDGTLWLNLGDTYMGGKGANGASQAYSQHTNAINQVALHTTAPGEFRPNDRPHPFIKAKELVGIPWRVALALQADGWYLRQDIIWHKPNPMPESVTDRCTKAHEYIFLLTKGKKYYYNAAAIAEKAIYSNVAGMDSTGYKDAMKFNKKMAGTGLQSKRKDYPGADIGTRNKRSVWPIATIPYKDAHFATFPEELPRLCLLAGCPVGGIMLDPFSGAGTGPMVARMLGINFYAIELNPKYIKLAERRLKKRLGLFI